MARYATGNPLRETCDLLVVPSARVFDANDVPGSMGPFGPFALERIPNLRTRIRRSLEANRLLGRDHFFTLVQDAPPSASVALLQTRPHPRAPHDAETVAISVAQLRLYARAHPDRDICMVHPARDPQRSDDARIDALLATLPGNVTVWRLGSSTWDHADLSPSNA